MLCGPSFGGQPIYTFPSGRFDTLDYLTSMLGGFLPDTYGGREQVFDYLRGLSVLGRQLDLDGQELYLSINRQTCPLTHTDIFAPVTLVQGTATPASVLLFGAGGVYYGSGLLYGQPRNASAAYAGAPSLLSAAAISDGITQQKVWLTAGVDFYVAAGQITFMQDPFANPLLTPTTQPDGSVTLALFLFQAQFDRQWVQQLYGAIAGIGGATSQTLANFINAVLDGVAGGTTLAVSQRALAAIADAPFALTDETVQDIQTDSTGPMVLTDQNVYRCGANAALLVSIGDALAPGQQLTDAVAFYDIDSGQVPETFEGLTLTGPPLGSEFTGPNGLTFPNEEVALVVTPNVDGYTQITFALTGSSGDVSTFFAEMHARGVAAGATLANYLDLRPQPQATQPTAANLPATLNPAQLIVSNALRYNARIVVLTSSSFGLNALGYPYLPFLRQLDTIQQSLLLYAN